MTLSEELLTGIFDVQYYVVLVFDYSRFQHA